MLIWPMTSDQLPFWLYYLYLTFEIKTQLLCKPKLFVMNQITKTTKYVVVYVWDPKLIMDIISVTTQWVIWLIFPDGKITNLTFFRGI